MFIKGQTKPLNFTLQDLLDALQTKEQELHTVTSKFYHEQALKRIPGSPVYRKDEDPFLLDWGDIFVGQSAEQVANVQREQMVCMMRPLANQSGSSGPDKGPLDVQTPSKAQQPSVATRSQLEEKELSQDELERILSSARKHQLAEDKPSQTESDSRNRESQNIASQFSLVSMPKITSQTNVQQNAEVSEGTVGVRNSDRTVSEAEDYQNSVKGEGQNKANPVVEKVHDILEIDEPSDILQNQGSQSLSRRDDGHQQIQEMYTNERCLDNSHNEDPFNTSSKREQLVNDESLNLEQVNDSAVRQNHSGLRLGDQGSLPVSQQPNQNPYRDFDLPPLTGFTANLVRDGHAVKVHNSLTSKMFTRFQDDTQNVLQQIHTLGKALAHTGYHARPLCQLQYIGQNVAQMNQLSPLAQPVRGLRQDQTHVMEDVKETQSYEQRVLEKGIDASVNDCFNEANALVANCEKPNEMNDDWINAANDPDGDQPLQQDPKSQPCLNQQSGQSQNPEQAQQPSMANRSQPEKQEDSDDMDNGNSKDQPAVEQLTESLGSVPKNTAQANEQQNVEQDRPLASVEQSSGNFYKLEQLRDKKFVNSIAAKNGLASTFKDSIGAFVINVNQEQQNYQDSKAFNGNLSDSGPCKQADHFAGLQAFSQPTENNATVNATDQVTFGGSNAAQETVTFGGSNAIAQSPRTAERQGPSKISQRQKPMVPIQQQSIKKREHSPVSKQSLCTNIFGLDNRASEINGTVTPESMQASRSYSLHQQELAKQNVLTYGDNAQTDSGKKKVLAQSRGLSPPSLSEKYELPRQKSKARQSSTTAQRQSPQQPSVNKRSVEQQADSSQQSSKRCTRSEAVNKRVTGQIGENPSTEDRTDKRTPDDGRCDVPKNVKTPKRQMKPSLIQQQEEPISRGSPKQIDTTDSKHRQGTIILSSQEDQVEVQAESGTAAQQVASKSRHENLCHSQSGESDVIQSEESPCQSQDYRSAAKALGSTENLKNRKPLQQCQGASHCPQLEEEEDKQASEEQRNEEDQQQVFRGIISEYLDHVLKSCQRTTPNPIVNLNDESTVELMRRIFFKDCALHQSKQLRESTDKLFTKRSIDKEEKDKAKAQLSDKILAMVLKQYHATGDTRVMQILNDAGRQVCYTRKQISDYKKAYSSSLSKLVAIVKPYSTRRNEDIIEVIEKVMDDLKPRFSKEQKESIDQKIRDYLKSVNVQPLLEGTYVLNLDAGRTEKEKQRLRELRHQKRKREKDCPVQDRKNKIATDQKELLTMINDIRPSSSLFALLKDGGGALDKSYLEDSHATELLEKLWSTLPSSTVEENVEKRDFWLYLIISYYMRKGPTVLASHFKALFGFEHVGYGEDRRSYKELYTCEKECGFVNIAKNKRDLEENIKPAHELICGTPIYTYHFMTHPIQFKFLRNNANSNYAARRCLICLKKFKKRDDLELEIFEHAKEHSDKERILFGCYRLSKITDDQWRQQRESITEKLRTMKIHNDLAEKIWVAPQQIGQRNAGAQKSILQQRKAHRPQMDDLQDMAIPNKRQKIDGKARSTSNDRLLRSGFKLQSGGFSSQSCVKMPKHQTSVKQPKLSYKAKTCMKANTQSQPLQKVSRKSKPIQKQYTMQSSKKNLNQQVKKANQSNDRYCSKKGAESASSSQE